MTEWLSLIIMLAQNYNMNCEQVAQHLVRTLEWVQAAFNYAENYPDEINEAIADFRSTTQPFSKYYLKLS
ncbi:MAG: hypothetical protein EBE86_021195 [Hormoscilla sp. GUM202]|nr:hypothetical protein [Hormoscilla sp. GUM202]